MEIKGRLQTKGRLERPVFENRAEQGRPQKIKGRTLIDSVRPEKTV